MIRSSALILPTMSQAKNKPLNIAITTGESDGIGLEVAVNALLKFGPKKDLCFHLYRSPANAQTKFVKQLIHKLKRRFKSDLSLIDIVDSHSPHQWVEQVALGCMSNRYDAMVTGPLHKDPRLMGHTEILARIAKKPLFMSFLGKRFNVVLLTGHLPLAEALKKIDAALILTALKEVLQVRSTLNKTLQTKPIGLVAINPHAGENGLIGDFEEQTLKPLIAKLKKDGWPVEGPLVPDVAFSPHIREKYSFLISPYHDQGLIPFKLVHGFDSGVHITLGAPFVRTSVDHGTASDLYGKNIARFGSMYDAIKVALKLCKIKSKGVTL